MRFGAFVMFGVSVVALSGCGGSSSSGEAGAPAEPVVLPTIEQLDIGDAEHHISVEVMPDDSALSDNITVEPMRDDQSVLMLVTMVVNPPMPASLPIRFTLRSTESFGGSPVAVQGVALRDEQELGTFEAVVGAGGFSLPRREGDEPAIWTYDVLEGLEEIPESMLVNARLTLKLTDVGTDEDSVDPATVQVAEGNEAVEFSNPVRINFVKPEAPAETPVEDESASEEPAVEDAPDFDELEAAPTEGSDTQ